MNFEQLHSRVVAEVRERVHNGELTERGFARLVGISQPHVHNVLKGFRSFSPESLDLVLRILNRTVLDLCTEEELRAQLDRLAASLRTDIELPLLESKLGLGCGWPTGLLSRGFYPVPREVCREPIWTFVARLVEDPWMDFTSQKQDLAAVNTSGDARKISGANDIFVVSFSGQTALRRIRPGFQRLYLFTDKERNQPRFWTPVENGSDGADALIRGKVIWFGRESDRPINVYRADRLPPATSR